MEIDLSNLDVINEVKTRIIVTINHLFKRLNIPKIKIEKSDDLFYFKTVVCGKLRLMFAYENLDSGLSIFYNIARYEKEKLEKKMSNYYKTHMFKKRYKDLLIEKYKLSFDDIEDFFDNWTYEKYIEFKNKKHKGMRWYSSEKDRFE